MGIVGWVESLQLRAEDDDMVGFQARIAYASEVPPIPLPPSGSPIRDIRNLLTEQTAAAKSAQRLTETRVRSRALLGAFAAFMQEAESHPLSPPVEDQGRCFAFRLAAHLQEENVEALPAISETSTPGGIFDPSARVWCATPQAPSLAPIVVGKGEAGSDHEVLPGDVMQHSENAR